ncbi:MAG: RNA methyltransferase [Bacteroidales bacterium]|nr:RNA methyltransferase [Bacteroidales bacterium]MDD3330540.1 RNA methyltransferase [Bacteroidales bacterium]
MSAYKNEKLSMEELQRISVEEFKQSEKLPLTLVLDDVRSMNNVGSVFRTADAFRIEHICLCGITAQPPHKEIEKTALGATESVQWSYYTKTLQAVEHLIENQYEVYAVEQTKNSLPLSSFHLHPHTKIALVFGHEVMGVKQEVIDRCRASIEIPQFGTKHSLNIAVSAGILMWHIFYQLIQKDQKYENLL